jgi:hypothetical protein
VGSSLRVKKSIAKEINSFSKKIIKQVGGSLGVKKRIGKAIAKNS